MALITAVQARLHIPSLTGDTRDADLDVIIARVVAALASWCGWPPAVYSGSPSFETATYTVYLDGPVDDAVREIQLPVCPVQSITTIHDDPDWGYSSTYLVASGDYTLEEESGRVLLNPTSGEAWSASRRSIKAVFIAGWDTAPDDLALALCLGVKHVWDLMPRQGKESTTAQGKTDSYRVENWPAVIRQLMTRFRVEGAFIG